MDSAVKIEILRMDLARTIEDHRILSIAFKQYQEEFQREQTAANMVNTARCMVALITLNQEIIGLRRHIRDIERLLGTNFDTRV